MFILYVIKVYLASFKKRMASGVYITFVSVKLKFYFLLIMMYPTLLVLFVAFVAVSARDEDEAYVSRYFMNIHFIYFLF